MNKIDFKYYPNFNYNLDSGFTDFEKQKMILNDDIYKVKNFLSEIFLNEKEVFDFVKKVIDLKGINRETKMEYILNIFNQIKNKRKKFKNINLSNNTDFIFKIIINEMLNDNIENLLLNGIVISDILNKDNVIIRDSETVLENIEDIVSWVNNRNIEY